MSPASSCFSLLTSLTTSPVRMVELLHWGSWRVEDTTYLGRLFSLSAHASLLGSHRAANHSSLRRPSRRASVPSASSYSTLAHSSRSLPPNWPNQPPSLKPSSPSGSWTTPSNETFVLITIFPILGSPFGWCSWLVFCSDRPSRRRCRRHGAGKVGARQPPSSPLGRRLYKMEVRQGAGRR